MKRKIFTTFTALLVIIASLCFSMPEKNIQNNTGVLLGLRYSTMEGNQEYKTIYIYKSDNQISVSKTIDGVLIPTRTGEFATLDIKQHTVGQYSFDVLELTKNGKTFYDMDSSQKSKELELDDCEGREIKTLLFANSDYISLEYSTGGYCKGAAHPWAYDSLYVLRLNDLRSDAVPIDEVFGNSGFKKMRNSIKKLRADLSEDEKSALEEEPQNTNWGLIRRRGKWVLRGRIGYSAEFARGFFKDFDIGLDPVSIAPENQKHYLKWNTVKSNVPSAVDVFLSPEKDMLIVISRSKIFVYQFDDGRIPSKPSATINISNGTAVVMAKWFTKKDAKKWKDIIRSETRNLD